MDGTNWYTLQAGSPVTGVSKQRIVATNVLESYVRLSWPAPTGTSPSLTIGFNFLFN